MYDLFNGSTSRDYSDEHFYLQLAESITQYICTVLVLLSFRNLVAAMILVWTIYRLYRSIIKGCPNPERVHNKRIKIILHKNDCQHQFEIQWFCFFQIESIATRFCKTWKSWNFRKSKRNSWLHERYIMCPRILISTLKQTRKVWTKPEHWIKKFFFKQVCFTFFFSTWIFSDASVFGLHWRSTGVWNFVNVDKRSYPDNVGLFGLTGSFFRRFST